MSVSTDKSEAKRLKSIQEEEEICALAEQILKEQAESGQPFTAFNVLAAAKQRKEQADLEKEQAKLAKKK